MMPLERPTQITIGTKPLPLPVFFPSISSVKTNLSIQDYVQVLSTLIGLNPQFLVSAFDLANLTNSEVVAKEMSKTRQNGGVILMDSGNYESFWKDAQSRWNQDDFHKTLTLFPCDLAFGFDEQNPPDSYTDHFDLIVKRWQADQVAAGDSQIIPIVHALPTDLPTICSNVAAETGVPILAVAERKLGEGIFERAKTVRLLRFKLNQLDHYVALHLLGTGNPISLALYAAMGADSFDGLEWCQTVVDHETGLLHHTAHSDFFKGQTSWGEDNLSFQARTLAHNLDFFSDWMRRLREAVRQGTVIEFCQNNLPKNIYKQFSLAMEWEAS